MITVMLTTMSICSSYNQHSAVVVEAFAAAKKNNNTNKKKKMSTASTNRGFGAPPPTLIEVLAGFKNKKLGVDDDTEALPCPCGGLVTLPSSSPSSSKSPASSSSTQVAYKDCCRPLHQAAASTEWNDSPCTTPLDVLKSRYSAFALRNVGYVIATTHPECRDYQDDRVAWARSLDKDGMFDSFDFINLELLGDENDHDDSNKTENDDENEAYLSFQVTLRKRQTKGSGSSEEEDDESPSQGTTIIQERSRFLRDEASRTWTYAGGDVRSQVEGLQDTQLNR